MSKSPGSPIPLFKIKVEEKGKIKDIKEIIVRVSGLPSCLNGQIVEMDQGVKGIIMGFDEDDVLVLVLGDQGKLRMGREVKGISEPFKIPVGNHFIGRMVSALGEPVDQGGDIIADTHVPVFQDSPPITSRLPADEFLPTGTKVVDVFVPIAKGQRQLILGDRMTGKTVIVVDAILNQKGKDTVCIYCCAGKSVSGLERTMTTLHKAGALEYTVIMAATDNAPVGEQYLVPFAAVSMGDYFASQGRDVLVVFDDLTKHAWAYRQLSLLLERPPGREAYPGDIFYVQTQLMERAGKFNDQHGGGSLTFLGIAETLQGDLTGYIPSNLTSMCDGQICMSSSVFAEGVRPAVDLSLSLSIIGGRVQPPILRQLSSELRSQYAQYAEVVRLSKLQSGLSDAAQNIVDNGEAILSILQQMQYNPVSFAEEILLLFGLYRKLIIGLSEKERREFVSSIYSFAEERYPDVVRSLAEGKELTPELEAKLDEVMAGYFAAAKENKED